MHLHLVGILQDNGSLDHVRVFSNETWAIKYGRDAGDAARYAELEVEFNQTPPAAKEVKKPRIKSES